MEYNQEVENWNREYPEEKKKKVSEERVKRILLMLKHHSLDELVKLGAISRRTKYYYQKEWECLRDYNAGLQVALNNRFDTYLIVVQKGNMKLKY